MIHEMMPPQRPLNTPLRLSVRVPKARPDGRLQSVRLAIVSEVASAAACAAGARPDLPASYLVRVIRAAQDRSIYVDIDHAGGMVEPARAITAALLAHRWAVHVRILGRCSSSAAVIAMAGDSCAIAPAGTVLLHRTRRYYTRDGYREFLKLPLAERVAIADGMFAIDDEQVALVMARTGRPLSTVRSWFEADRKWSATEAVDNGFADYIRQFNSHKGTQRDVR